MTNTTSQINDLIGRMRENNRAARGARFFGEIFCRSLPKDDVIISFLVLTTTQARSSKSFILCLCMKILRAKQV